MYKVYLLSTLSILINNKYMGGAIYIINVNLNRVYCYNRILYGTNIIINKIENCWRKYYKYKVNWA